MIKKHFVKNAVATNFTDIFFFFCNLWVSTFTDTHRVYIGKNTHSSFFSVTKKMINIHGKNEFLQRVSEKIILYA